MSPDEVATGKRGFFADVPVAALWLGLGGAIPFVGLSGASLFVSGAHQSLAHFILLAYGAVILSFLGGIRWGRALAPDFEDRQGRGDGYWQSLGISVIPSLVGWLSLLVPITVGLPVLAASFAVMLLLDLRAVKGGYFPAWYANLRVALTVLVVVSLLLAWL